MSINLVCMQLNCFLASAGVVMFFAFVQIIEQPETTTY